MPNGCWSPSWNDKPPETKTICRCSAQQRCHLTLYLPRPALVNIRHVNEQRHWWFLCFGNPGRTLTEMQPHWESCGYPTSFPFHVHVDRLCWALLHPTHNGNDKQSFLQGTCPLHSLPPEALHLSHWGTHLWDTPSGTAFTSPLAVTEDLAHSRGCSGDIVECSVACYFEHPSS